jgi:hypothetical protein
MFYHFKNTKAIIALALGLTLAQPAAASTINFDSLTAGDNADSDPVAMGLGITFNNAAWLPDQDSFGIDIPGSEHWQVDNSVSTPVMAENTFANLWGLAPSGQNALDARWSPILMHFAMAIDIGSFSVTLPDSPFGNLSQSDILFLDAAGKTLYDLAYYQGNPLATVSLPATKMPGVVQDILLASGTFYDNLSVTAVPEPDALWLLVSALPGLAGLRRRKS